MALSTVTDIVSNIPNTGIYTWTPNSAVKTFTDYVVEIQDVSNLQNSNYSPYFTIMTDPNAAPAPAAGRNMLAAAEISSAPTSATSFQSTVPPLAWTTLSESPSPTSFQSTVPPLTWTTLSDSQSGSSFQSTIPPLTWTTVSDSKSGSSFQSTVPPLTWTTVSDSKSGDSKPTKSPSGGMEGPKNNGTGTHRPSGSGTPTKTAMPSVSGSNDGTRTATVHGFVAAVIVGFGLTWL